MITKITHITLFVHDQDKALDFYKTLGFKIHTDATFEDFRWLTLNIDRQQDVELVLMPAITDQDKALVGKQGGSKPFISFQTTDCQKEYEELTKKGIKFIEKPNQQPWGISAAFYDLYGNVIYMAQEDSRD